MDEVQQRKISAESDQTVSDVEVSSHPSSVTEKDGIFTKFSENGLIEVEEGTMEHYMVKRSFLSGLSHLGAVTEVVAVHNNWHSSTDSMRKARLDSFRIHMEAVSLKNNGNANLRYAWFGASIDELIDIAAHGFSRCKIQEDSMNHSLHTSGLGVCLYPARLSLFGATESAIDDDGFRHLLLCRVLMGKMEVVRPDSMQSAPSSIEYDSGVDNLSSPRRLLVWTAFMNSYISPDFIISFKYPCFKSSDRLPVVKPQSPWLSFPILLSKLSKYVEPWKMALSLKYYKEFKERRLSKTQLVQKLRKTVGDSLLMDLVRMYSANWQTVI